MIRKLWLCLFLTITPGVAQASEEEPLRFWKDAKGGEIVGELVASDGIRVTLRVEDNSKKVFPLSFFSDADRRFIVTWRNEHPQAPWIDPQAMPAWPLTLNKVFVEARHLPIEKGESGYAYRSPHFELRSDVELPLSVVSDMATIFEATRHAVHVLPLGLAATPPLSEKYKFLLRMYPQLKYNPDLLKVHLYGDLKSYARSGAPAGSGGFHSPTRNLTVLSLQNLGIKGKEGLYRHDYMKSDFVLKHEITHHLLQLWTEYLPVWLKEGFSEYMAAAPYAQGKYQFNFMDRHMHKYLNKWRLKEDPNRIPIMKMEDLMTITPAHWAGKLKRDNPILEYNSAAILVHFFIHHDGKGDASHLAAYFDSIRQGVHPSQAEKTHLIRDRSYEQLDKELKLAWEKNNVALERVGDVDPFK